MIVCLCHLSILLCGCCAKLSKQYIRRRSSGVSNIAAMLVVLHMHFLIAWWDTGVKIEVFVKH